MSDAPELTALVLMVAPSKPAAMPAFLGRAVYRFWLHYLESIDSSLTQQLHDDQGSKPFTCSSLIGGQRTENHVRRHTPEEPAWLRITGLTTTISSCLRQLAAELPQKIELNGVQFRVLAATMNNEDHPWAGQTSVEQISAPHLLSKAQPAYRLQFNFASPTTFRSGGYSQPVPMPSWVFGSLLDRWNAFSPVTLSPDVRRFAEECVVLSRYQLRTRAIPYKNIVQPGCIGDAYYVIMNRDRYWASILNLLADYAFYGGVGYQTTVGLGQVQRLEKKLPPTQTTSLL